MPNKTPKISNLKPFKKGESGNPDGLKKGTVQMRTRLKRLLEISNNIKNPLNGKDEDITIGERMALAQIKKAVDGDTRAFDTLMRTVYGTYTENDHNVREVKLDIVIAKPKNKDADKSKS